jgi:hypothetical protein
MYDKASLVDLNYHLSMLTDSVRTSSLQRAIESTVKPGDTVVDLGCGTGLLSYFACRAGARKVYAIEMNGIIDVAKKICASNGFNDRIQFINAVSSETELPERVDVIVTETIGNFGLEEGILMWISDARERFLKPDGVIIPRSMDVFLAPIEHATMYKKIESWDTAIPGFDFSAARAMAASNLHWTALNSENLLGAPAALLSIDLLAMTVEQVAGTAVIDIQRDGTMHGLGGWFRSELAAGVELTNAPPLRTPSWTHAVLPAERPVAVRRGDRVCVRFLCPLNSTVMNWQIELQRNKEATLPAETVFKSAQSTFFGRLFSKAALDAESRQSSSPRAIP